MNYPPSCLTCKWSKASANGRERSRTCTHPLVDPSGCKEPFCFIERSREFDSANRCGSAGKLWEPDAYTQMAGALAKAPPAEQSAFINAVVSAAQVVYNEPHPPASAWTRLKNWLKRM